MCTLSNHCFNIVGRCWSYTTQWIARNSQRYHIVCRWSSRKSCDHFIKQFNRRYGCQLCLHDTDLLPNAPMVCCCHLSHMWCLEQMKWFLLMQKRFNVRSKCKFFIVSPCFGQSLCFSCGSFFCLYLHWKIGEKYL